MVKAPPPALASKRKALQGQVMQQVGLFDRLADPLLQITGRKGRVKWANQAAHDLLGEPLGEPLVGQRFRDVFHAGEIRRALRSLRQEDRNETEFIAQPQNLPTQEFRVRLVRLDQKTVYGARVLVALSDVSQILRLQAQRADFVADASHELKTPVAALSGFVETLQTDPEALATFLPLMAQETGRMRALIDDLLRLTKTEMQTHEALTQWIDPLPLLDQAIDGLHQSLENRGQRLVRHHSPIKLQVRGDATGLTTVFSNLLRNASAYSPQGEAIEVQVEGEDTHLIVHFHNAGQGIAAEHIPRLTERFYRVDDGRGQGGTGLGLAIVKHILIRHQGHLHIRSSPGEGATFSVELPARRAI